MEVSSGRMAGDEVLAFFQPQAVPADCRAQLQHQLAFKRILVGNQKETVEFELISSAPDLRGSGALLKTPA